MSSDLFLYMFGLNIFLMSFTLFPDFEEDMKGEEYIDVKEEIY